MGAPTGAGDGQQHFGAQRDSGDAYPYDPRPNASNGSAAGAFPGVQDGFQRTASAEIHSKPEQAGQTQAQTDAQKGNRLRKACDSCSIRKVKVSIITRHATAQPHLEMRLYSTDNKHSAMNQDHHAEHAPPSRYHARSSDHRDDADHRTDTPKPSSAVESTETLRLPHTSRHHQLQAHTMSLQHWHPSRHMRYTS